MEKKVMDLCEAAKRGAEEATTMKGEVEEAQCIDALDQLNNSPITSQLLVSSQLVRHILPLTKHPRKKIQDLASDLIVSWRNMFLDQMKRGEIQPAKAENVDQKSTPSNSKKVGSPSESIGPPLPQKKLICMIPCNYYFRDKVREKLYDILSKVSGEVDEQLRDDVNECDPIRVAITLESVMFETWGGMNGLYEIKYRSLLFFLNHPKLPDFRRKVLLGHVSPEALVQMRAEDIPSDLHQRYNQELKEKQAAMEQRYRAAFMAELKEDIRDSYICGRCGHTKTNYNVVDIFNNSRDPRLFRSHKDRDVLCLNCYQYWESVNVNYGLLPIPE